MPDITYPAPSSIQGPAIVQIGADYYESKEDIKLQIVDETSEVSTITRGKIAETLNGRKVELKFKPVKWSKFSSLFALLNLTRGQMVFGQTNTLVTVWGADGTKVELPRAQITAIPSIGCGIGKDLLGEFTITGVPDPTKPYSNLDSLIKVSNGTFPSLPALTDADIETAGFVGILMTDADLPHSPTDIFIDLEDGAEISFDVSMNERKINRCGLYDFQFVEVKPSVKLKPMVGEMEKWKTIVSLLSSPKLGGVVKSGYDLILRGLHASEPMFKLRKVICSDRGLTWGDENRFDEIELKAMGNYGIGKFEAGTTSADWDPSSLVAATMPAVGKSGKGTSNVA